jgi:uncharacterized spore protein YtfJ
MAVEFIPIKSLKDGIALMKKSIEAGHVRAVFGDPITQGERTIITAAEVSHGLGYGVGGGYGDGGAGSAEEADVMSGAGGGGGGGAGAMARPIAAIIVEPEGVRVEPIVDVTKVVLAFFTMFGSLWVMLGQMRKAAK